MAQKILIEGQEVGGVVDSDVVERPAIIDRNGKVTLATPEMEMLPVEQLKILAKLAQGKLVYRKYNVSYREIKTRPFCDHKGCWALADGPSGYCYKHEGVA